jgi:hypothetical protein
MSSDTREIPFHDDETPYCGHFDNVDEETMRRLFSKVAAVRSEDRELFDFTHRRIEVYQGTQGASQVVSEAVVYEEFSEARSGNFAVVIEGEVGTGKSELCAYLAHRLADDGRPILHVDKDDDLMSLLTDRIPSFYREHFDQELSGTSEFEQLRYDIEHTPQTVANNAASGALLNLSKLDYDLEYDDEASDKIRKHVQSELQQLVERGEYAKEVKFVTTGDLSQKEFLDVFATGPDAERPATLQALVEILNTQLWREIRDRYGTASLNEVLEQVGRAFEETRPVIVFEDFSITAMEGQQLRKYMERDKGSDNWDFIVAGTRDSTGVLHTRTAEDRFEFYQTNEPDSNSVLFLDEETAVEFVRPYLGYFKSLDGSVQYDRSDETELTLQPAPDGSICAECGLCDESFRDLFPFHGPFLKRIYTGLNESEQSPREYIMKVFDVLEQHYRGYVSAPSNASALEPLEDPLLVPDAVEEASEELANLVRWYGLRKDGHLRVDLRFAAAFGLIDPAAPADLPAGTSVTDGEFVVPTAGSTGSDVSSGGDGGTDPPSDPGGVDEETPIQREIDEHVKKIGAWKTYPTENTRTGVYLQRGLGDAIDHLTDGFALYEGSKLQYNLSSQQQPFVLTNTTDAPEEFQIDIDPDEFRSSDLRRLLKFGIRRDMAPRSADYDALFRRLGTQLSSYAVDWREQVRETNLNDDDVLYKRRARYDFTDFVLAAYALVVVFDSPWQALSAEAINDRFEATDEYELDPAVASWCKRKLTVDEYQHINTMIGYAPHLEDTLGEVLGVSGSALDLQSVRKRLRNNPPYEVLSMLGRAYTDNIDFRVKFDGGPGLSAVADTAYDFRKAIDEVNDFGVRQEVVETVNTELAEVKLGDVRTTVDKLDTYDGVSSSVLESLKQFTQLDQASLDEAVETASDIDRLTERGSPAEKLRAILASAKLEAAEAYTRYDAVELGAGGGAADIGARFSEVSQHYVE